MITEPVLGLEYLPGVLQGIRAWPRAELLSRLSRVRLGRSRAPPSRASRLAEAVQGQIPYVSEVRELPADGAPMLALAFVVRGGASDHKPQRACTRACVRTPARSPAHAARPRSSHCAPRATRAPLCAPRAPRGSALAARP